MTVKQREQLLSVVAKALRDAEGSEDKYKIWVDIEALIHEWKDYDAKEFREKYNT